MGWTIVRPTKRRQSPDDVPIQDFVAPCSEGRNPSSPNWEDSLIPTSAWYQGESLKQLLQGAALGAFATLGIGFSWGGFILGSTAKTLADSTASSAVVAAIAPICVDQFQRSADAADNLTALKKTSTWEQAAWRCHENGIWPLAIWKSQFGLRPRWRLATSGTLLLGGRGACGGR